MSGFFDALTHAAEKVDALAEDVLSQTESVISGIVNPNRPHGGPQLPKPHQTNNGHRFNSFADQRSQNFVKWHVDGHDYLYAVSEMLDSAKHSIYILDWWLTPELYLRRPPAYHPEWRLDKLLKRKAEQGVKIYVAVYQEIPETMSMSSQHTENALEALHPNIACMRHPDHIPNHTDKDVTEFWSHHEVVVVDNHRACIGGLDLCFGRFDTHNHPLADVHPTDFSKTLFPGQDYNNARVLDFQDVSNYISNAVPIQQVARMPWHDVHMTLEGPVVLDIIRHFVGRWNFIKRQKYAKQPRYELLGLPQIKVAPDQAVARPHPPYGTCRVQVVRSVSEWSHGVPVEHSVQNAYRALIRDAEHYIYIENQFFISNTKQEGPVKNLIAQALVERILRAARSGTKFKVVVVIPELPGFAGNVKDESSLKVIMAAQYRTMNRGGNSIYEEIRKAGFEPMDYIRFYNLRSYDRINAPDSLISKMEANSKVKFKEAQVALARLWMGDHPYTSGVAPIKEVFIMEPQPSGEGIVQTVETKLKGDKFKLPASEAQAKQTIENFERGAYGIRNDDEVADSVSQHALNDKTGLLEEIWLGTDEEEKNAYVSELLYIHTKLMIVDDKKVILGSANLNDRSQKGDGDSEIALVVEDDDLIDSTMDGMPYPVARFATTLRRALYKEHLGLIPPQDCQDPKEQVTSFMRCAPIPNEDQIGNPNDDLVADPLADSTLQLWNDTAKRNKDAFAAVFRPVPTDLVRDWKAYQRYVPKVKIGHVVPEISLAQVKDRLSLVKGSLVECPLDFLIDEKDFVEGPDWIGLNPLLPIYI